VVVTAFVLLNVLSICLAQYQKSSLHSGRYTDIYFPASQVYFAEGKTRDVNVIIAPKTYMATPKNSLNLCGDVKTILQRQVPELWNNTQVSNPCEMYFCSPNPPKYFRNGTYVPIGDVGKMLNNSDVLHTQIQQFCSKCEVTYGERFDLTLLDSTRNGSCKWYRQGLCDDYCPQESTCFLFNSRTSLCFNPDNTYMSKADFFHYWCLRLRVWGLPFIYLIVNLILLLITTFCVVIPEVSHLHKAFKENVSIWVKAKMIFSLRNQIITIEVSANILYIICATLDVINFSTQTFTTFVLFIHFAGVFYSWSLLIILWTHLWNHTYEIGTDDRLNGRLLLAWLVVTTIGAVYAIVGVVLYLGFVLFPDVLVLQILLMLHIIFIGFSLFVVSIFLIISSVRLLYVMEMPKNAAELGYYFFKLKLTRCIIAFIIILYPSIVIIILNGAMLIWNDFLTIYFSIGVITPATCIMAVLFGSLTCFTLIHNQKLKELYCSKNK
jgi:hypothetical protein